MRVIQDKKAFPREHLFSIRKTILKIKGHSPIIKDNNVVILWAVRTEFQCKILMANMVPLKQTQMVPQTNKTSIHY